MAEKIKASEYHNNELKDKIEILEKEIKEIELE